MAVLADLNTDQLIALWGVIITAVGIFIGAVVTIYVALVRKKSHIETRVDKREEKERETIFRIKQPDLGKEKNANLYRVFIGSPGGLEAEREILCQEIDDYNRIEANPRDIHFRPVRWEEIPSQYGRPQGAIDSYLVNCNAYVLILWDRWGSPPSKGDEWPFSSGSEEEFYLAEDCLKNNDLPMSRIAVYFKGVGQERLKYPDDQIRKIKEFKEILKQGKKLLFGEFDNIEEFRTKIREFLADWLQKETQRQAVMPQVSVHDVGQPGKRIRIEIKIEEIE